MCVYSSRESRVRKGFGVLYRSNSSDINGYAFLRKKKIFLKANKTMRTFWKKLTYK